jgi:hypothetical protein
MRCTGTSKQSGEQCNRSAKPGHTKCKIHGADTPVGIASHNFKTGIHSKWLPPGLLEAYGDAQSNPNLLSVRGDVELLDALILSKLVNLDTGESAAHWDALLKSIVKARRSYKSEDYGGLEEQLDEMEALADKRRLHYATEQEITSQLEQRRKLVDTENKIILSKENAITNEQAMLLVSALLASVKANVPDAVALNRIQADFVRYVGGYNQQRVTTEIEG